MTTYTWNSATSSLTDWNTRSDWLPMTVPDSADADVVIASGSVEITDSESYVVNSLTGGLTINGTLSVLSGLSLENNDELSITGSLSIGSLSNGAPNTEIVGSGQISSTGSIDNQGYVASYNGNLALDFAELQNLGTLASGAGGSLTVNGLSAEGAFANLSGGTLSLGTYEAFGGVLDLNVGGDITTDAASIILGSGMIETNSADPLSATLRTIATAGSLTLKESFAAANALDVAGYVESLDTLSSPHLTIEAGGTVESRGTISGPVTDDGSLIDNLGLVIDGAVDGIGTIAILPIAQPGDYQTDTLEVADSVTNTVSFDDCNGVLVLDSPQLFTGQISGFTTGVDQGYGLAGLYPYPYTDFIILSGLTASGVTDIDYTGTSSAGTLTFQDAGEPIALQFEGDYVKSDFAFAPGPEPTSTLEITDVQHCFLAGTHILTPAGEVPVEALRPGELVTTVSGAHRKLRWIGFGRTLVTPRNRDRATPVVVRKHALAKNVPHRDLYLTRGHSLFLDGVLIPVEQLVNHRSIAWVEEAQVVEYYHLELDSHDVVLAEGVAAETFREDDNSPLFLNLATRPATPPTPPYAPVLQEHETVGRAWRALSDRAGRRDLSLTDDPNLHLLADGVRLDARVDRGGVWRFQLPGKVADLRIVSRSAIPAMIGTGRDHRRLGVALRQIVLAQAGLRIDIGWDAECLATGFHAPEPADSHRWTDGQAALPPKPVALLPAGATVELHVASVLKYYLLEAGAKYSRNTDSRSRAA